jgi:hypothetical protein
MHSDREHCFCKVKRLPNGTSPLIAIVFDWCKLQPLDEAVPSTGQSAISRSVSNRYEVNSFPQREFLRWKGIPELCLCHARTDQAKFWLAVCRRIGTGTEIFHAVSVLMSLFPFVQCFNNVGDHYVCCPGACTSTPGPNAACAQ